MIMDTKELMIGDLVYCEPEGKTVQVTEVRADAVQFHERSALTAFEDELQPILLTDEILDKNAERCDLNTAERWTIRIPGEPYLQIYRWRGDDHYEVLNGLEIRYVHELQHALRLCGEYELADNLKLK